MDTDKFFEALMTENKAKLESQTGMSRQAILLATKTKNLKLNNLKALAKEMHLEVSLVPNKSEDNVLGSLKRFSAPLAVHSGGNLSLEEALCFALPYSRKEGLYESVVPFTLLLSASKLNTDKLLALSLLAGQARTMGYFLDLAYEFSKDEKLNSAVALFKPFNQPNEETLLRGQKVNFRELFTKNEVALRWNLLVRGTKENHFDRWNKWLRLRKTS